MPTITHIDPRQDDHRLLQAHGERRVSLNKLGMVAANLALWAVLISGVALIAH